MTQTVSIFKFNDKGDIEHFHTPTVSIQDFPLDNGEVRYEINLVGSLPSYQSFSFDIVTNGDIGLSDDLWLTALESAFRNIHKDQETPQLRIDASREKLYIAPVRNNVGDADFEIIHPDHGKFYLLSNSTTINTVSGWPLKHVTIAYHSEFSDIHISEPRMSKYCVSLVAVESNPDNPQKEHISRYTLPFKRRLATVEHAHLTHSGARGIQDLLPSLTSGRIDPHDASETTMVQKNIRGFSYYESLDKKMLMTTSEKFEFELIDSITDYLLFCHLPHDVKIATQLKFQSKLVKCFQLEDKNKQSSAILRLCVEYWDHLRDVEQSLEFLMGPLN